MPPTGAHLADGFSSTISFANYPNAKLWEKEITPPGIDAGGRNEQTTMRNSVWRTALPKKLKTMTAITFTATYAVASYTDLNNMVGENQLITVDFEDGGTVAVWGWVDKFTPDRLADGTQPQATVTIELSHLNASQVETGPVITPA